MATKKKAKMGRPRKLAAEKMGMTLNMRLDAAASARLDAIAENVRGTGMGRSTVARLCMLLGLALAERDLRVLLVQQRRR